MTQQISGYGTVLEVNREGFRLHVEQDVIEINDSRWFYYSQFPAWYNNYPTKRPIEGDRVALTAQFNLKTRSWHIKEYAFINNWGQPLIQENQLPPLEEPMSGDENSKISGNFLGAKSPDMEVISQSNVSPVPVEYVALELACQVAPALMNVPDLPEEVGKGIVQIAESFKSFLERK